MPRSAHRVIRLADQVGKGVRIDGLGERAVLLIPGGEDLPHHGYGQSGRVPLAGQQTDQPAEDSIRPTGRSGPELALDEGTRGGRLGIPVDLGQRLADQVTLDASLTEFTRQCPTGESATVVPAGDPGPGERGIVDQADLVVPV